MFNLFKVVFDRDSIFLSSPGDVTASKSYFITETV